VCLYQHREVVTSPFMVRRSSICSARSTGLRSTPAVGRRSPATIVVSTIAVVIAATVAIVPHYHCWALFHAIVVAGAVVVASGERAVLRGWDDFGGAYTGYGTVAFALGPAGAV
jgi:hypothetical protein